mgnify:CR=1 FL=1
MIYRFEIRGNQENPKGNPIPYHRTTQRAKWKDPAARRYAAWKKFVQQHALEAGLNIAKLKKNGDYRLDVTCFFVGEAHGDPGNIRKGVEDSLFEIAGDKHVWGMVDFAHASKADGYRYPSILVHLDEGLQIPSFRG